MSSMMEDLEQECREELEVIQSIYEKEVKIWQDQGVWKARYQAFPRLPEGFKICVRKQDKDGKGTKGGKQYPVTYLPPLDEYLVFPSCYPSKKPPSYTLSCPWLTREQMTKLCQELDRLWMECSGSCILYSWFSFLDQNLMEHLQITSPLELMEEELHLQNTVQEQQNNLSEGITISSSFAERLAEVYARSPGTAERSSGDLDSSMFCVCHCGEPEKQCPLSKNGVDCRTVQKRRRSAIRLLYSLVEYSRSKELEVFKKSVLECSVCWVTGRGDAFMYLESCRHSFCRDCLGSQVRMLIKENRVQNLKCLEQGCDSEVLPSQVKELVSKEEYVRYEELSLKAALESMSDIVYCPRRHCQTPVIKEGNFGHCSKCFYAFCTTCTQEFHHSKPCPINSEEMHKVYKRYTNGNKATREYLEKRYGKRLLQQAVQDASTLDWIKENTNTCPQCGAGVQKNYGCNMMSCACGAHFCWLCGKLLREKNPYDHFLKRGNDCYAKTFYDIDRHIDQELVEMFEVPEDGLVLFDPWDEEWEVWDEEVYEYEEEADYQAEGAVGGKGA